LDEEKEEVAGQVMDSLIDRCSIARYMDLADDGLARQQMVRRRRLLAGEQVHLFYVQLFICLPLFVNSGRRLQGLLFYDMFV